MLFFSISFHSKINIRVTPHKAKSRAASDISCSHVRSLCLSNPCLYNVSLSINKCCKAVIDGVVLYSSTEKAACPGLGLLYSLLAAVFFSVAALLVKKIDDMHAIQISAIRCFFQMLFVMPAMIYYKYESVTGSSSVWLRSHCTQSSFAFNILFERGIIHPHVTSDL